jgi:hypothetical protein
VCGVLFRLGQYPPDLLHLPHSVGASNGLIQKLAEVFAVEVGGGDDAEAGGFELKGGDGCAHSPGIGDAATAVDILHILKSVGGLITVCSSAAMFRCPVSTAVAIIASFCTAARFCAIAAAAGSYPCTLTTVEPPGPLTTAFAW